METVDTRIASPDCARLGVQHKFQIPQRSGRAPPSSFTAVGVLAECPGAIAAWIIPHYGYAAFHVDSYQQSTEIFAAHYPNTALDQIALISQPPAETQWPCDLCQFSLQTHSTILLIITPITYIY
jgi:hypothetical protein